MVNVTQEMFADGHAIATAALEGETMPAAAMSPKSLAAGSATSLYAALDPSLKCKHITFPNWLSSTISSILVLYPKTGYGFHIANAVARIAHSGAFLVDCNIWTEPLRPHAVGSDKAEKLWTVSEKLVGEKFAY